MCKQLSQFYLLTATIFLTAFTTVAAPLQLASFRPFKVNYADKPLIIADHLGGVDWQQAKLIEKQVKNIKVYNLLHQGNDISYRKELGLLPNGNIELTVKAKYSSYMKQAISRTYSFSVPLATLDGARFKARFGLTYNGGELTGTISSKMKDGALDTKNRYYNRCRYIAFEKAGFNVVFDFNPIGVTALYGDYGFCNEPIGVVSIKKSGDNLIFSWAVPSSRSFGRTLTTKVLISSGKYAFAESHPYSQLYFHGAETPSKFFAFNTIDVGLMKFECANTEKYNDKRQWGWSKNGGSLNSYDNSLSNIFTNGVIGQAGKSYEFSVKTKPGLYLCSLNIGHPEMKVGPVDIKINGKAVAKSLTVAAGKNSTVVAGIYLKKPNDRLNFTFSGKGNWSLHSIALKPLVHQNEDFSITRQLWLVPKLFTPDFGMETNVLKAIKAAPQVPLKLANDWRYTMKVTNWERDNADTGFEFNTPELVKKRVTELKALGYNTIMYTTLFWHLCYLERWQEAAYMAKMVVNEAHRQGMAVIFHIDAPVVLNVGSGLKFAMKHADWFQQDIRYNNPALFIVCYNNPDYQQLFTDNLAAFVKISGVDCLQLDEIATASNNYCGCRHCREKFFKATGKQLPLNSNAECFNNSSNALWKEWLLWRVEAYREFWRKFKTQMVAVKPNIHIMQYTTHWGFYSTSVVRRLSVSLEDMGADFIGTEIHTRNIQACFRAVYALRKLFNTVSAHSDNIAEWGLVYAVGDKNIAYFGWALNQMCRQSTWFMPAGQYDFFKFTGNMDFKTSTAAGEVAVLYSETSKIVVTPDANQLIDANVTEVLGVAELLSDIHVQYQIINDSSLTVKGLKPYKLIIIPSTPCLSRKQLAVITQFVKAGGRILVTGSAGRQNEIGASYKQFPLIKLLGLKPAADNPLVTDKGIIKYAGENYSYTGQTFVMQPAIKGLKVLATENIAKKNIECPLFTVNRYGKGKAYYLATRLGAANYEVELGVGRPWKYQKNQQLAKLFYRIFAQTAGDKLSFKALAIPQDVLVSVFKQNNKTGKSLLVHILNATGADKLTPGMVLKNGSKKPFNQAFPALKNNIIFEITTPTGTKIKSGYIVSPDYSEKRPVTVEHLTGRRYKITVSKHDINGYSIVYLQLKR